MVCEQWTARSLYRVGRSLALVVLEAAPDSRRVAVSAQGQSPVAFLLSLVAARAGGPSPSRMRLQHHSMARYWCVHARTDGVSLVIRSFG